MRFPRTTLVWVVMSLGLLAACVGPQVQSRSPARDVVPKRIRVLTYNIHHGQGTDGRIDLERIARVIRSANPDVVALQEVDRRTGRSGGVDQAETLGQLTGMTAVFGKAFDFDGGEYGNAVLSRLRVTGHEVHPLPKRSGHEDRALLEVRVGNTEKGSAESSLTFFSTHLDHHRNESDRMTAVAKIAARISADTVRSYLLAGDLNARPNSQTMRAFRERWSIATGSEPLLTAPARNPRAQIDYVLFRPRAGWRVVEVRVLDEPIASDHRPLLAVLEYSSWRMPDSSGRSEKRR